LSLPSAAFEPVVGAEGPPLGPEQVGGWSKQQVVFLVALQTIIYV